MNKPPALTYAPGPSPDTVRGPDGRVLTVPDGFAQRIGVRPKNKDLRRELGSRIRTYVENRHSLGKAVPDGWVLLPPGDAALTRRVKAAGDVWAVAEKRGRKVFSRGVWAPAATVEWVRAELGAERSTEGFARKKVAAARRREQAQAVYVEDFYGAVVAFLAFHPDHADLAARLARAVTDHATPVGRGTVARTKRIPVEQRAEAAVIAWLRHQTTGYDGMTIPRVKGTRREVRRVLAQRSKALLTRYRQGEPNLDGCPLHRALGPAGSGAARPSEGGGG